MSVVHVCRTTQERVLRVFAIKKLGCDKVAEMSDREIVSWLESEGFQSYIEYCGEYDDTDDILIAKASAVQRLVANGDAF